MPALTLLPDTQATAEFIADRYADSILQSASNPKGKPLGFYICLLDVFDWSPALAIQLVKSPQTEAILRTGLLEAMKRVGNSDHHMVTLRLHSLPLHLHLASTPNAALSTGQIVQFEGIITRTGAVRMREQFKLFECSSCSFRMKVEADEQQYGAIPRPASCPNSREDGLRCRCAKFNCVNEMGACEDFQEVRVQELRADRPGAIPRSVTVLLRTDLVDSCKAGDAIICLGRICIRWKPTKLEQRIVTETVVLASSIDTLKGKHKTGEEDFGSLLWNTDQPLASVRSTIVNMFCPEIHGMFPIKLAVLLTVIGGCSTTRKHGHLLLVGDPGTAKSHFLHAALKLSKRAVMVSGSATSNAGLTVTAVREAGGWSLEAGAMVLADGGLCCIDEFAGMKAADRTALHEALEQQTVSIAKAGMVCRLPTRCSVIAACNSKDRCDDDDSAITSTSAMTSPLLSRFDLIFVLLDRCHAERDASLADHLLHQSADRPADPPSLLPAYIASVKDCPVEMTAEAKAMLSQYYQKQRQQDLRDAARTTIRLLESLIRLAEAHAKLCMSSGVREVDAECAIRLMDMSLTRRSDSPENDIVHKTGL